MYLKVVLEHSSLVNVLHHCKLQLHFSICERCLSLLSSAVCVLSCGRYRNEGNRVKARCLVITALNSDYECETPAYRYTQAWYISNRMITYTVLHYTTSINEWCLHYRFWRLHLIVLLKGKCREQLCLTLPFRGLQVL